MCMRLVCFALLIFLTGCDFVEDLVISHSEEDPWVGDWDILTIDGYSVAEAFEIENFAHGGASFYDDGTWSGYVYAGFIEAGIAVEISLGFEGTYELSDSRFTLAITGGEEIMTDGTGEWELEEDTLTLRFDDGGVIVLQRFWYDDTWYFDDEYPEIPQSDAQAMTGASQ